MGQWGTQLGGTIWPSGCQAHGSTMPKQEVCECKSVDETRRKDVEDTHETHEEEATSAEVKVAQACLSKICDQVSGKGGGPKASNKKRRVKPDFF